MGQNKILNHVSHTSWALDDCCGRLCHICGLHRNTLVEMTCQYMVRCFLKPLQMKYSMTHYMEDFGNFGALAYFYDQVPGR